MLNAILFLTLFKKRKCSKFDVAKNQPQYGSDNNNCKNTTTVTITPPHALTLSAGSTSVTCNGDNSGTATVTASGGTNPYNYLWSNAANTSMINNLLSTIYSVTVTDNNGCVSTTSVTIAQPSALTITLTATDATCNQSNGTATIEASGGNAPYTYDWLPFGGAGAAANGLATGNYTVTVTDKNNCVKTQTVFIGTTISPTATAYKDATIIPGGTANLSAWGGTFYAWTPATGLSCPNCQNTTASPTVTTVYCVEVTDANGCTSSICVTVTVDVICAEVFVPTAFSPNGDIENELLCLYGINCIKSLSFIIYDRWGDKVFQTFNPKVCWNGIYKSKELNEDGFVYYLEAVFNNGKTINRKGNIFLIR